MAAPASKKSTKYYEREQQRQQSGDLLTRLQRLCRGMDYHNESHYQVYKRTRVIVTEANNISDQIKESNQRVEREQSLRLNLYGAFATKLHQLYEECQILFEDIPEDGAKPKWMEFLCYFFEATKVFAGKPHMGFKDHPRRGYDTIHQWNMVADHAANIRKFYEEGTPQPLADDEYKLSDKQLVGGHNYRQAGIWCEKVLCSVVTRFESVHNQLEAVEFLYEMENRHELETYIKKRGGKFPFHSVTKIETTDDERTREISQNLMDDEKQALSLAKKKVRQRQAKAMADLEKQNEELTEKNQALTKQVETLNQQQQINVAMIGQLQQGNAALYQENAELHQENAALKAQLQRHEMEDDEVVQNMPTHQ